MLVIFTHSKAPYTLSVNLSDFILWRHTWRKNWVTCAVLTGSSSGHRTVISSRLSHRELRSSLGKFRQFPQFTCRHHYGIISRHNPCLAIHSADEHRMIYSFSNTISYSIFYAFFSSFRITILPVWLAHTANDSLVFIHHSHTQKKTQRTDKKKNWQTWWETCAVPENIRFRFSCVFFFTQLNCTIWFRVYGALKNLH